MVGRIAGASPKVIAMVKEAIKIKDVRQLPADQKPKGGPPGFVRVLDSKRYILGDEVSAFEREFAA